MARRSIKTLAGLHRVCDASRRSAARLYARRYILEPALVRNLARFEELKHIEDPGARFEAFRQIPALEFDLEAVHSNLTPTQRTSLAQQDRAKHPRIQLAADGTNLETIVAELLAQDADPWRLKAKQYWPKLIECLSQMGLAPSSVRDPKCPTYERIQYFVGGKRRYLTMGHFANLVSKTRGRLRTLH
jgi:hypothetical protein